MHPRQASIAAEIREVLARIAATQPAAPMGQAVLWKYEDPEGNKFYLEVKKTTVKSPFSGKSFSARPVKHTPAQVGKEMKDERKESKTASEIDLVSYVDRVVSAAGQTVLWQYKDPDGNLFWLDRKITTALRSPYGGSQFTPKGKKVMPSQIGKNIENEADDFGGGWDDPPEFKSSKD